MRPRDFRELPPPLPSRGDSCLLPPTRWAFPYSPFLLALGEPSQPGCRGLAVTVRRRSPVLVAVSARVPELPCSERNGLLAGAATGRVWLDHGLGGIPDTEGPTGKGVLFVGWREDQEAHVGHEKKAGGVAGVR